MQKRKAQMNIEQHPEQLNAILEQLHATGVQVPENFNVFTPDDIVNWADEVQNSMALGDNVLQDVRTFADNQRQIAMSNPIEEFEMAANTNSTFNLKKFSQVGEALAPNEILEQMESDSMPPYEGEFDTNEPVDELEFDDTEIYDPEEDVKWSTHSDLKTWLDEQADRSIATDYLTERIPNTYAQAIDDALESYYEGELTEEDKLKIASQIFDILPDVVKNLEPNEAEGLIAAPYVAASMVRDADKMIQKMAQKKDGETFNMKKFAQHKTIDENVIMYGPGQTRIDPFLRQPISDKHIVERNKGFGLVVDDIWNIDWEALWRGNIMDKYSRAFRDNDGNWVGGYLNKRFETDKWIPENNNYQLKPGQLRRPYIPEQRGTEARLEAMRAKKDRGYEPDSNGKPYNWAKEASSKKKS